MSMSYRSVTTPGGVRLAVTSTGPTDAPVVLLVHGFPDDSSVWDGVIEHLRGDFHVAAYDCRGAGRSDRPRRTDDYRLPLLAADLAAVIDEISPDRPVHVVAHDWGSIQVWYALTRPGAPRIASYTSISGPELSSAGRWVRAQLRSQRTFGHGLRQIASSSYIGFFRTPLLPEALSRIGLVPAIIGLDSSRGGHPVHHDDVRHGLALYRANMRLFGRRTGQSSRRGVSGTRVPVMVIAPTRDRYVTARMQHGAAAIASDLRLDTIEAGHWVPLSHPGEVAARVRRFVSP